MKNFLIAIALVVAFTGCGYRFTGSGTLPGGIQTVSVAIFENRTAETGIEATFANDLIYEFTRNGNTVRPVGQADASLTGVISSMSIETVSRKGQITSLERQIKGTVSVTLTDREGKEIWSVKDISEEEAYGIMSEKVATDYNKRAAIDTLSRRLAERIYDRMTQTF
ncbi:hypothetical protein DENIS_0863 [Desulfonema ishimotonii]|uniref:Uncharacterized protein n=1 Tax=Desulfonema ishimotonii TaxID=45657 RepID=A0A401FSH3_9BACT|nr:LptE family protein [Desulfonema ishimotonii]GBC59921.1 hypothetical protein DENIS_0863 [Desulfonema ishimotonii]